MGRTIAWAGEVIGTAGGGLVDAGWAANDAVAKIGRQGELRTAEILDPLASDRGMTVIHDLHIPIPGFTANIDHAVVAGRTVLLIDTKVWKPNRYWTLGQTTRRGWRRFDHAKTKTPRMAQQHIGGFLTGRGLHADLPTPLVAVWSSSKRGTVSVRWLKMDGCTPVRAEKLARLVRRALPGKPADPAVVAALRELVNGERSARSDLDATPAPPVHRSGPSEAATATGHPATADPGQLPVADDPFAPIPGITLSTGPAIPQTPDDDWAES